MTIYFLVAQYICLLYKTTNI